MEGERQSPIEQEKSVPFSEDITAYLSMLEEGQKQDEETIKKIQERMVAASKTLTMAEKAALRQNVAEAASPMPLSQMALEDTLTHQEYLERAAVTLKQGMEDMSLNGIPSAAFVEALKDVWHLERQRMDALRDRMNVLRHRHAEGEHLSPAELEEVSRLSQELVGFDVRSKRMRVRIHTITEARESAEREHARGETTEQRNARRERLGRRLGALEHDPRNQFNDDKAKAKKRAA